MSIESYPVTFEGYDDSDLVFTVKAFDECCASVEIKQVVTVESWDEISQKIRECLVSMKLK